MVEDARDPDPPPRGREADAEGTSPRASTPLASLRRLLMNTPPTPRTDGAAGAGTTTGVTAKAPSASRIAAAAPAGGSGGGSPSEPRVPADLPAPVSVAVPTLSLPPPPVAGGASTTPTPTPPAPSGPPAPATSSEPPPTASAEEPATTRVAERAAATAPVPSPRRAAAPPPLPSSGAPSGSSTPSSDAGADADDRTMRSASPSAGRTAAAAAAAARSRSSETARAAAPAHSVPPPDASTLWSGRLRPGEEVGRGATGSVIRGTDTKLRRELAIKVTAHPRDKLPTGHLARFVEEAQITAQLEHPNVVPVHDLGVDPQGRAYFSMKLVRGASLESILERRKKGDPATLSEFGLRRLLDVFLQVCQGVDYAHARGVIHRDLKPANIMVGDFGEVLVMDWGVAKLKGRSERVTEAMPDAAGSTVTSVRAGNDALATQMGAVLGTPVYMSPEQALGKSVDERTDIYALGVILYEILCGEVPFSGDDPVKILARVVGETPRPPSQVDKRTPLALEALVMRLLEKDPEQRTLTIRQIRSHVQDYIEGIGHEYRRESLVASALWLGGAIGAFAFVVWYLTGQSIATFVALTPAAVFNAVGWLLLAVAAGYPLWAAWIGFGLTRRQHDRFRPPTSDELFVSGYLAHRTHAAAIAPVFQLAFIVELLGVTAARASRNVARSGELMAGAVPQLRAEWVHALLVILLFLFAYLLLLSIEVRFARRIDRYTLLAKRPRWEAMWPSFLIVVLVTTVVATDVLDWTLSTDQAHRWTIVSDRLLTQRLDVFDVVKTIVFQSTFLLGLVAMTVVLAFPFPEVLASLRMAYQPADDASVGSRQQYFLRSMAVFQVAGANWLYGGAMIASLTAVTILSEHRQRPLVEQVLYILGPWLIGFVGHALTRRYAARNLADAPAVRRMLHEQTIVAKEEQARANLELLERTSWRRRFVQLAVPVVCVLVYLVWTGSGVRQQALRELMVPVSTKGWLLILPYALLAPLLLVRDELQLRRLRRQATGEEL